MDNTINTCDVKHNSLDRDVTELKNDRDIHETRITTLEKEAIMTDFKIKNILETIDRNSKSMETLISWIKWGLAFVIPITLSFLIWLLQQQLN